MVQYAVSCGNELANASCDPAVHPLSSFSVSVGEYVE